MHFELAPIEFELTTTIEEAIVYCFSLTIDNKTGWRLPTLVEMQELGRMDIEDLDGIFWLNVRTPDGCGCKFYFDACGIVTRETQQSSLAQARPVRTL